MSYDVSINYSSSNEEFSGLSKRQLKLFELLKGYNDNNLAYSEAMCPTAVEAKGVLPRQQRAEYA